MKNKILALVLICAVMLGLCSCNAFFGRVDENGDVTVVIENVDGSYDVFEADLENVENKEEGAKGVVEYLGARKNNKLGYEMTESTYGAYISKVGSISEDASSGLYIIVYTSNARDSYDGSPTIDYNGTTLYQAGMGLSGMSVEEGTIILFRLEKSPY